MKQTQFPHRLNKDGTYDSICKVCFQTVGSNAMEAMLAELEKRHVCVKPDGSAAQTHTNRGSMSRVGSNE